MSGPKYSEAELKRMEEERLEEERKKKLEEMRRILEEARGRLKREYDNLNDVKGEIKKLEKQISEKDDFYYVDQIQRLLVDISKIKYDMSGGKEIIEHRIIQIKETAENFKKQIGDLVYKNGENTYVKQMKTVEQESEKEKSNIGILQEQTYDKYYELLEECEYLYEVIAEDGKVIESISKRLKLLLENKEDIHEIEKMYCILKSKVHDSQKKLAWRLSLYDDYVIKAATLNESIQNLKDFQSLDYLKKEIERLDMEIKENDKLEYISKAIEEVMLECGHEIVRSDIVRQSTNLYQKSYFDFDGDGVISVTQSSEGAIVMEIAVVGDDDIVSQYEKEKAVNKMISFCSQYPELAKRLEEKGIIYKQVRNMPPDECFVKKLSRNEINRQNKKRRKNDEQLCKNMQ